MKEFIIASVPVIIMAYLSYRFMVASNISNSSTKTGKEKQENAEDEDKPEKNNVNVHQNSITTLLIIVIGFSGFMEKMVIDINNKPELPPPILLFQLDDN